MYRMSHEIRIGDTVLPILTSVKIRKDVTKLTDTATITCPAVSHGRNLTFVKGIAKWQRVSIKLGYDDRLETEFEGYVKSVATHENMLEIECEDALLLFQRVDMPNGEMKDATLTLKKVLEHVLAEVNSFISREKLGEPLGLNCAYEYGYNKKAFLNETAYSVMESVQKEGLPNIFIHDNVLNIAPQFMETAGEATYSMQRNICKEGMKLKWRDANNEGLYVEVKGKNKEGKEVKATKGKPNTGNKLTVDFGSRITDQTSLETIADNIYRQKVYTGYEGDFAGWLVPFCDAGYLVRITDERDTLRAGRYYVTAVTVEYSSSGGKRTVSLGAVL